MKNIRIMKNSILLIFILFIVSACADSLEKLNVDENRPSEVTPGQVLPSVSIRLADILGVVAWNRTDQIMQYHSITNDVNFNNYVFLPGNTSGFWDELYYILGNIDLIESNAQTSGFEAYRGAALVYKAYLMTTLSELWIDVPYLEAGLGLEGVNQPVYNTQEEIYLDVLSMLEEANTLFAMGSGFIQDGDHIYDGDELQWQKLANSLRLRYLLRLSNVTSVDAGTEIAEIFNSGLPLLESNDDNALFTFDGVNNIASVTSSIVTKDVTRLNEAYVDYLQLIGDPRLSYFADLPVGDEDSEIIYTEFVGIESGILDPSLFGTTTSSPSDLFFSTLGAKDYVFMTHSEVAFIQSEAILNGWITGDAEAVYEEAIKSNMNFWGLALPEGYFDQEDAAWDGSLERLIQQKWVSFYNTGSIEAWGDYKRTGYPELVAGPANVTGGVIPTRFLYPLSEQSLNSVNYTSAAASIGGDNNLAMHWYQ